MVLFRQASNRNPDGILMKMVPQDRLRPEAEP